MKALIGMAVLSATVLALGACATTSEDTMDDESTNVYGSDEEYMARVEAAARRRGIDVQWVHPPRRVDTEAIAASDE